MGSRPPHFKNVPPPQGSKAGTAYTRFIPREELGDFASWKPGTFGQQATPAPTPPAEPKAAEWQARVQAARQAGYQDGYRDGLAALENFKQVFAQQATAQIGTLLEAFDQQLQGLDTQMAHGLAQAAVQLARQVLRTELTQQPAVVAQVAAEAVSAVMLSARHIAVHVHPLDLPLVAEGAEESLTARGARLQADPAIERGGVLVVSDVGSIDARIATRWAQAVAELGSAAALDPSDKAEKADRADT
jgi:flagellar assembly protein FliH